MNVAKMIDTLKKLTPKSGFNVVAVDDFDREPYLVKHCKSEAEAKKVQLAHAKKAPSEKVYIYKPV